MASSHPRHLAGRRADSWVEARHDISLVAKKIHLGSVTIFLHDTGTILCGTVMMFCHVGKDMNRVEGMITCHGTRFSSSSS